MKLKELQNIDGFRASKAEGKDWNFMSCDIAQNSLREWHYEISLHTFYTDRNNKRQAKSSDLCIGTTDPTNHDELVTIWDNFINKYNPDEYFVEVDIADDNDYLG